MKNQHWVTVGTRKICVDVSRDDAGRMTGISSSVSEQPYSTAVMMINAGFNKGFDLPSQAVRLMAIQELVAALIRAERGDV